jgi:hypothetical protein
MLFYIAASPTCFGSYRVIIRATNAKERVYEFTVALENTTCASVYIQNVVALDILYVYSLLLVQCYS